MDAHTDESTSPSTQCTDAERSESDRPNSYYPPPPSMYSSAEHNTRPFSYETSDCFYDLPDAGIHHTEVPLLERHKQTTNPVYSGPVKNKLVRDSIISEDLPLPPPPQAHIEALTARIEPPELDSDEETCIKGLSPNFKSFLNRTIAIKPLSPTSPTSPRPMRSPTELSSSSSSQYQLPPALPKRLYNLPESDTMRANLTQ